MAIEESDREDLLREATGYPRRVLVRVSSGESVRPAMSQPMFHDEQQIPVQSPYHVFIGCRSNGAISVYWDAQPVFQFNIQGQLRRAYYSGNKYAARNGKLFRLNRAARGGQVQTQWNEATLEEHNGLQAAWISILSLLREVRDRLHNCIVGQVPQDDDLSWVQAWLNAARPELAFAENPNA